MDGVTLDEYGRVAEWGVGPGDRLVLAAPLSGPIVPPLPEGHHPRSGKWPAFLRDFLKAHRQCEGCGRAAATGHHRRPFHLFPDLELDPSNIAAVCVGCHWVICHCGDWKLYVPTVRADLAAHLKRVRAAAAA